jgi:hypothetical protein
MTLSSDAVMRWIIAVIGVALVWLAFFRLNDWLFSQLAYTERAHWIFLPAALRVLAVLLLGSKGAVGLMAGAYLTLPHEEPNDLIYEIALSVSSGLAPLAAVAICQRFFKIKSDLGGLRGAHIVSLSAVSALANSVLLNILLFSTGRHHGDGVLAATIFIGDMLGAALVLLAVAIGVFVFIRF